MKRNFTSFFLILFVALLLLSPFLFRGIHFALHRYQPPAISPAPSEPARPYRIYNTHEHFQSIENVPKFLEAMKQNDVIKTVIVGSPEATILMGRQGFFGEEKYNEEVLKIANDYPEDFIAFPTINVRDPQKLEKLKDYLQRGGKGLKLYSGHSLFHDLPLDDPTMMLLYQYCEENKIPILFHVNAGKFQKEFENVLRKFPRIKIICPHFCLSTIASDRFEYLMDTYPNLYTDLSFGYIDFLKAGLLRISKDPEKMRQAIIKYQDRIFFGTDMVVTSAGYKTADWLSEVTRAYRDMLEKEQYHFPFLGPLTLRGLHLDSKVLEKIYRTNFERFFYGKEN